MKTKINIILTIILLLIIISPIYQIFSFVDEYEEPLSIKSTRDDSWILELQQNFDNPQWYYNQLNDQDRLKIRQAFDWSIDRNYIINDLENSFGMKTLSYIQPGNQYFLHNGTMSRQLNLTKAKSLLTEVFGFSYDPNVNNPATPYDETKPYFKLTDIYSENNPNRVQWVQKTADNWRNIGIDVKNVNLISTGSVFNYFSSNESNKGYSYDFGGFDVAFIGWDDMGYSFFSPGYQLFIMDLRTPQGIVLNNNLYYDQLNNNDIYYYQNKSLRNQAIYDYQQWIYNNVPTSFLFLDKVVNIKNKDLKGIDPSVMTNYENWTFAGHQNATIIVKYSDQLEFLNPIFGPGNNPGYLYKETKLVGDSLFRGLFYRSSIDNQGIQDTRYYPYFANWYNKSANGKTWFVNLKQGLKWHDGVELNSSDIKFTFESFYFNNVSLATVKEPLYQPWLTGNINISIINATLLKFELENPYSFFKEDFLTLKIIPKHILENIPKEDWYTDPFNTGINGTVVGNGPYIYVNRNKEQTGLTLQEWNYWDSNYQSLIIHNAMNEPIPDLSAPTLEYINFISIISEEDALNFVKNGSADITLQNVLRFNFKNLLDQITDPVESMIDKGSLTQVIHYNLKSPIWGLDAVEPCKLYENISCLTPPPTTTSIPIPTTSTSNHNSATYDSLFMFLAFITISLIAIYKRKKKL